MPFDLITIENPNDIRVRPYGSLKVHHPDKDGVFIAESKPVIKKLLKTGHTIISCLTTEKVYENFLKDEMPHLKRPFPVYLMRKDLIENTIGFKFHHGIMMAVKSPEKISVKEQIKKISSPRFVLALNGVHDPQNVGLIIRNAAAFGVNLVIVDKNTCEPFYRKPVRISMGSIFTLPIAYEDDLLTALSYMRESFAIKIMVSSLNGSQVPVSDIDLTGDICLVLGNEASGISEKVEKMTDTSIKIPHIYANADSLNVACAGAIVMNEAFSQRYHSEGHL